MSRAWLPALPTLSSLKTKEGAAVAATALICISGWYAAYTTNKRLRWLEEKDVRRHQNALRDGKFNKGYPNTWYFLCKASDVPAGTAKTFRIAGREILAFRSPKDDALGLLHPFCPHLGTNLKDGRVTDGGRIVCPAHGWSFKTDGTCANVPESKQKACDYPKGAHAKQYHHATYFGMVYVWIDAEWREPQFDLEGYFGYVKGMTHTNTVHKVWDSVNMNIMEPTQNSADIHHFKYLHADVPYSAGQFHAAVEAKTDYCYKGEPHVFRMDNQGHRMTFAGKPVSERTESLFSHSNSVICYGPAMQLTVTSTAFCNVVHMTYWVPTDRFTLDSYYTTFVDKKVCTPIAWFLENLLTKILDQDKAVWEARDNSMRLMDNDGFFVAYREWLNRFFSEGDQVPCTDSIEW